MGDLQGIAGKAMPEIPSLDMPLLEASTDPEAKRNVIGKHRDGIHSLRFHPRAVALLSDSSSRRVPTPQSKTIDLPAASTVEEFSY